MGTRVPAVARRLSVGLAALILGLSVASAAAAAPLYYTSFEEDVPFVGGPEWQKPPGYPWMQNSNDPMNIVEGTARTGERSANQHETFSQWSAMRDFGLDLHEDFYVKAWVNFQREKERIVNVQPPCQCALPEGPPDYWKDWTNTTIAIGTVTGLEPGGQQIVYENWPACRISEFGITDANTYFHSLVGGSPDAILTVTSGVAMGKQWRIQAPTFYTCGGPPYGVNPLWNHNQTLQVTPVEPNTQDPIAAGVQPGDSYEIKGRVAPLYRAIQLWVENKDRKDFAKFGIWHRYTGDPVCTGGVPNIQCRDSNNWKYITRNNGQGGTFEYFQNPWIDTGIHRGYDFTGWHSLEVRVYGDNEDPQKDNQFHFLVDDEIVATSPRYTAEGPVGFNRIQIGGLAVSQESAQWDDIEIGLLPEAGPVTEVASVADARNMPDGSWVSMPAATINRVGPDWFQIQSPGRLNGMRCIYTNESFNPLEHYKEGDVVVPTGRVQTIGCEKVLYALSPHMVARGAETEEPVWADYRAMTQANPSMQGLLVATWGKVVDPGDFTTHFYIDDRSDKDDSTRIKVVVLNNPHNIFELVTVKGVLGCEDGQPVIYVSDGEKDIETVEFWVP